MSDASPIFVEVQGGVAFALHETEPAFAGLVDVVAVDPAIGVKVGWLYDAEAKAFSPPLADPLSLANLAQAVISAASASCSAITKQVIPDDTHQTAYANAATIVWGNGGQAPTADPAKTIFAAQASALGLSPATFAAVVLSVSLVSLQLGAALSTLRGAALAAKTAAQIGVALTAFESSLSAIVAALKDTGLTVEVTAPPPITIIGVSA